MTTRITQRVLSIFLASPSDLGEERTTVRQVVDSANKIVRDLGWHIELYGWEDTLPGICRPQTLINEDVDRCDLFIGILWKRWGQPTGLYSSGFEEEFIRARKLNSDAGLPEIWAFFKRVDSASVADPGEQLKNVIKFKKEREHLKDLFFKEFETSNELAAVILELLLRHIIKSSQKAINSKAINLPEISESLPQKTEESTLEISSNEKTLTLQPKTTMMTMQEMIDKGALDFSFAAESKIENFDIMRFYLTASSLASERCTNNLLGPHEINLLFIYREKLELTPIEQKLLFRTLIGGPKDVIPGWYWFKGWEPENILQLLFYLAISDRDQNARMNAIALLRDAKIRPKADWIKDSNVIDTLIGGTDTTLSPLILSYLTEIGTNDDLALIDQILKSEDKSIYPYAISAKLSIISRTNPNEALNQILSLPSDLISKSIISMLERESGKLESALLVKALKHYNSSINTLAVSELVKRGELTQEIARSLLVTSNRETKLYLYKFLIDQGWKPNVDLIRKEFEGSLSAQDELLYCIYNDYSDTELEGMLDWYNLDAYIIYKILCLRNYEQMRSKILTDLDDNFENFHRISQEKFKQKYGDQSKVVLEAWDQNKLRDFIRMRFTLSAISVIAEHDDPESIRIARKYINEEDIDVRKMVIKIIEKKGNASDAPILIDICKDSYGELKELAANAALKLKPGVSGTLSSFILIGDGYLIKLGLNSLRNEPIEKTRGIVEILLQSNNDFIRSQAVSYLIDMLSKEELETLLVNYQKDNYYYNVVCWLDRILYAPSPLKDIFKKELEIQSS